MTEPGAIEVASLGDVRQFDNGRQVSAWLGLVPRQHSSGGKNVLLGITKRGDSYLRTLLIHGAADPLMPLGAADALAALIPGAQVAAFAECAHAPFLSRADDFVTRARSFLHE